MLLHGGVSCLVSMDRDRAMRLIEEVRKTLKLAELYSLRV